MIRVVPDQQDVPTYIAYFWDRLLQEPNELDEEPTIRLGKKPRYYARRDLVKVKTSEELAEWAIKWLTPEDWRKARDAVRASRYKERYKLVRANLRKDTKALFDSRAQHYDYRYGVISNAWD
ncbi:hypothetical protein LG290_08300 [Halomonas sediminis]